MFCSSPPLFFYALFFPIISFSVKYCRLQHQLRASVLLRGQPNVDLPLPLTLTLEVNPYITLETLTNNILTPVGLERCTKNRKKDSKFNVEGKNDTKRFEPQT